MVPQSVTLHTDRINKVIDLFIDERGAYFTGELFQ